MNPIQGPEERTYKDKMPMHIDIRNIDMFVDTRDKMPMHIDIRNIDMFVDTRDRTVFNDLRGDV